MKGVIMSVIGISALIGAPVLHAQEVHQDLVDIVRAEVVEIVAEEERKITGTDTTTTVQTTRAALLSGDQEGAVVEFQNDFVVLEAGDVIFLNHLVLIDGAEYYEFKDFDRRGTLIALAALFVGVLLAIAGKKGARALLSLIGSIAIILFVLVPLLLAGYPPVMVSIVVAGAILASAIFVTHGWSPLSLIAFCGTFGAVVATGVIASVWVELAKLTGFASDASIYLNFSTQGALDFGGLLLGSIMIGVLGVLDDVAVTQSSITQELVRANPLLRAGDVYRRALRVGRDHIGSLVNTLALAYIGVSLPLVMLFARSDADVGLLINQEVIAAELVRTFVGSIGLMLAVPLTTGIAAWWFTKHGVRDDASGGHTHTHV